MPFGLTNLLAIFQGYINKILVENVRRGSVYDETALAFWDAQRDWIRYLA